MGGSVGTHGRQERCIQGFGAETGERERERERENYMEDLGLNRRIILEWIAKKWEGVHGLYCIDLAQDMDRWRAVVNAVMNLGLP